jgi:hypothetical protein
MPGRCCLSARAFGIFIGFIEEVLKKVEAAAVELWKEKDRRIAGQAAG